MNLDIIRNNFKKLYNKEVIVHVYGMRNKNEKYVGKVTGVYSYVFTVNINGSDKSFNYADVIVGDVVVKLM